MKALPSNIDLTENRDFGSVRGGSQLNLGFVRKGKKPWNLEFFEKPLYDPVVSIGNKHDRNRDKNFLSMDNGEMCVRCGRDMSNKLWLKGFDICKKCDELLEYELSKNKDMVLSNLKLKP